MNNVKLHNCMDVIAEFDEYANPILCLQETKLQCIPMPTEFDIEHSAREGKTRGGITTIYPVGAHVLQAVREQYTVYL